MSIESRCTIGAIASKKARSVSPVRPAHGVRQHRRGEGTGRDDHLVPVGRRQRDLLAPHLDQRMRLDLRRDRGGKSVAVDRERTAGRHLVRVAARMISEPSRRISSCSSPTALVSRSSERNELEQTSSASASSCARRSRAPGASRAAHRHAAARDLPRRLAARESAADDVNRLHSQGGQSKILRVNLSAGPWGSPLRMPACAFCSFAGARSAAPLESAVVRMLESLSLPVPIRPRS
jgi:hypothetical protein